MTEGTEDEGEASAEIVERDAPEEHEAPPSETFLRPSPNFDARDTAVPLQYIVLHYTGMLTREAALHRLCHLKSKVSAHYLIDEKGLVFKLVEEAQRAWHAGTSFWRGITDLNSASIGIELVNPGHTNGYPPFPKTQIARLKALLMEIAGRHKLKLENALLAHSDIAPERKEDPGELFPWRDMAREGFGLWPEHITPDDYAPAANAEEQKWLRAIGYACPDSGFYDLSTRAALVAFQRHYEPDNITGTPERETLARLRSLARMTGNT